jgi:uncharacterized membrane protein YdbT with pleckstrin-like domain
MGTFVQNSLIKGEKIQEEAVVTWWSQWALIAFGLITLYAGIGILFIAIAIINVASTELAATNKKLIGKVGFIRRSSIDIPLQKIESINVDQGIFGRMVGYGRISIRGTGGNQCNIPYIKNPLNFRRTVMNIIDETTNPKANS